MATGTTQQVVRQLRRLALRDAAALTDGELLDGFLAHRDEAAFAALVRRHGPMVWGVCRRLAGHAQDAEDAFQATFLVLARKAATVRPRDLVGPWLYGVACRTARKARAVAARRRAREKQVPVMPPTASPPSADLDWLPLLDHELGLLPEKYRVPIVLCDLEGRTRREVARQLKLPDGTLSNRLAAGRRMLARRLARHGVTLSAGAIATALLADVSTAAVPASQVAAAIRAVAAPAAASAAALSLSEGVVKSMLLNRLRIKAAVLTVAGLLGLGAGAAVLPRSQAAPPAAPAAPAKTDIEKIQGAWLMVGELADGWRYSPDEVKQEGKRWTFHGDRFLVTRASEPGKVHDVTFQLDPAASPGTFDYVPQSGDNKGQTIPGVYKLDGDLLFVADDATDRKRPTGFRAENVGRGRVMVFVREGAAKAGTDADFLKRASLHLRGEPPSALESRYFAADPAGDKRATALALLLGGTAHDRHAPDIWADLAVVDRAVNTADLNLAWQRGSFDNGTLQPWIDLGLAPNVTPANPSTPRSDLLMWRTAQPLVGRTSPNWRVTLVPSMNLHFATGTRFNVNQPHPDAEYLRRLSLDLVGAAPTALELHYFVADTDPKKRDKVLDWLIRSDAHARHTARAWRDQHAAGADDRLGQLIDRLLAEKKPDAQVLEALTLAALARYPTDTEKALIAAQVVQRPDRRAAWEGVLATLLSTPEARRHIDGLNRRRAPK